MKKTSNPPSYKYLLVLLSIFLLSALPARALTMMPTFSLTVIANTYGDEGIFNFELATLADQVVTTVENFNLETVDRTIRRTFPVLPADQAYPRL